MKERRSKIATDAFFIAISALLLGACQGPSLAWVSPSPGTEVWGVVRLQVHLVGTGAAGVNFYLNAVDGTRHIAEGEPVGGGAFVADWWTEEAGNGTHMLYAVGEIESGEPLQAALPLTVANRTRHETIPSDAVKLTPEKDPAPMQLTPDLRWVWHDPVPMPDPVNTAGAEDSPFVTPDGGTLYFWFTVDPSKDVHAQAEDPMTGIYWTQKVDGDWQEPQRLWLRYYDQTGLDGAQTAWKDQLWFASVREGNYKDMDIWIAHWIEGRWRAWENAGKLVNESLLVGELHLSADGEEIFFDSTRPGGAGGKDIWVAHREGETWSAPTPVAAVNTPLDEGWPFLTQDGSELWFTRAELGPQIYRTIRLGEGWSEPQLVLTALAGEPSLDAAGNLYFAHHRWDEVSQRMSEADIYVCYRR
jgi:hypothetical protein